MEDTDELRDFREQWMRDLVFQGNEAVRLYQEALSLEQRGEVAQAIEHYRKAFRADPNVEQLVQPPRHHPHHPSQQRSREDDTSSVAEIATLLHEDLTLSEHTPPLSAASSSSSAPSSSSSSATAAAHHPTKDAPRTRERPSPSAPSSSTAATATPFATTSSSISATISFVRQQQQQQRQQGQQATPARPVKSLMEQATGKVTEEILKAEENYLVLPERPPKAKQLHISVLPDELMVQIFKWLTVKGVSGLSSAMLTCKRWLLYSQDPEVWRFLCTRIWPGCPRPLDGGSWRTVFIHRLRIRHDGIYISKISYLRQGYAEGAFNQPIHLIVYYRYLRFYRDGTVLSMCCPDPPTQVISQSMLRPGAKGVSRGVYTWEEPPVVPGKRPFLEITASVKDSDKAKYVYHLSLELCSSYPGGSNKITWRSYCSTKPNGDFVVDYPIEKMGVYYFSRVRSYS